MPTINEMITRRQAASKLQEKYLSGIVVTGLSDISIPHTHDCPCGGRLNSIPRNPGMFGCANKCGYEFQVIFVEGEESEVGQWKLFGRKKINGHDLAIGYVVKVVGERIGYLDDELIAAYLHEDGVVVGLPINGDGDQPTAIVRFKDGDEAELPTANLRVIDEWPTI